MIRIGDGLAAPGAVLSGKWHASRATIELVHCQVPDMVPGARRKLAL